MTQQRVQRQRGRKAVATRLRLLYSEPLCRHCNAKGITRLATQVDHIIALVNGGEDTDENKQPICADCHKVKTAIDMGYRPRITVGLDGWPVE